MTTIILIILFLAFIFVMRAFGAWIIRIDEIIKELQKIRKEIQKDEHE